MKRLDPRLEAHIKQHRGLHCTDVLCDICAECILCGECSCASPTVRISGYCDGEDLVAREDQDD